MKNSKLAQNKKRKSRIKSYLKQKGSANPDRIIHFNVYFNYFKYLGNDDWELLTRTLTPYEIGVLRDYIIETRDIIAETNHQYIQIYYNQIFLSNKLISDFLLISAQLSKSELYQSIHI